MSTHLTLIPVCLVKAASASFGGAGAASVTVIVTPDVLPDAAELPELPPPQAASAKVSTTAAAAARPWRPRVLPGVLAIAPLLRCAAIAESGRGRVLAHAQSLRNRMR